MNRLAALSSALLALALFAPTSAAAQEADAQEADRLRAENVVLRGELRALQAAVKTLQAQAAAPAGPRVAVVDLVAVYERSGLAALHAKERRPARASRLKRSREARARLEAARNDSDAAKAQLELDELRAETEAAKAHADAQGAAALVEIRAFVQAYAKKEGLELILDGAQPQTVFYAPALDRTKQVAEAFAASREQAKRGSAVGPIVLHLAPSVSVRAERGSIRVGWSFNPENSYVLVTRHEVERSEVTPSRDGGAPAQGPWVRIASLSSEFSSYRDTKIRPELSYRYRVVSHATIDPDSPTVRRERLTLPPEHAQRTSSRSAPVSGLSRAYVLPRKLHTAADAKTSAVTFDVYVFDLASNAYLPVRQFEAALGATIGAEVKRGAITLDYRTGVTLVGAREVLRTAPDGRLRTVIVATIKWPRGRLEEVRSTDAKPKTREGGE